MRKIKCSSRMCARAFCARLSVGTECVCVCVWVTVLHGCLPCCLPPLCVCVCVHACLCVPLATLSMLYYTRAIRLRDVRGGRGGANTSNRCPRRYRLAHSGPSRSLLSWATPRILAPPISQVHVTTCNHIEQLKFNLTGPPRPESY